MTAQKGVLEHISPTLAEALRECFYRVYLSRTGRGRQSPGAPARLGIAVHEVLASAAAGRFKGLTADDFEDEFADTWNEAIARQQTEMENSVDRSYGRLVQWRSYETLRAQARQAVLALKETDDSVQFIEHEFRSRDGVAHGTPDRVICANDEISIEDYKTGLIYELDSEANPSVKAGYRRQVLFYAALVAEALGSWPRLARVVGISGETETIEVKPSEAMETVDESTRLLRNYNKQLRDADEPSELASPTETACGFCPYQHLCEPHWEAANPGWASYISVEGPAESAQVAGDWVAVRVSVQRGTLDPGLYVIGRLERSRFRHIEGIRPGTELRVTKLRRQGRGLVPGWYTTVDIL